METEVHVYALAIAASVLLSFFPFLIVMVSLFRYVFHWSAAVDAIYLALQDYFPGELGAFVKRNLEATVISRGPAQITSIFLLLFAANGIFEPLEVALNRVWRVKKNRSYWKNQIVSLGLIFACGGLALMSFVVTALNKVYLVRMLGGASRIPVWSGWVFFKLAALPLSILALFFIYWLLPNRKIRPVRVAAVSILVGLGLEFIKYVNLLIWPLLYEKLTNEYGPFKFSVTILLSSFVAAIVVLAGAHWAAGHEATSEVS